MSTAEGAGRSWWCELAWLGGPDATSGVLLETGSGGRLARVTAGVAEAPPDAGALRGLTLPGLVNAHSHAFHRGLRGRTQTGGGSFWTWRETMYALAGRLDPERYLALATAAYAEMVLAGITTVGEFHYLHHDPSGRPYSTDAMGEAIVEAAARAGIRLTLLDTCYLWGGIGREPDSVQRRFSDGIVGEWARRVERLDEGPELRVGAAVHSVRALDPGAISVVASWAGERGAPLHAHVSEQPAENEACIAAYGLTPTALLAEQGALGGDFTAVHATHLDAGDLGLLGSSGSSVCFCPTTERDLADGIGPAGELRAAGARLCLGSDSHAVVDLLEEARGVELDERLATGRRGGHHPAELLADATARGAESLGWPGGGRLVPGSPADWCTLDTRHPCLAGTFGPSGAGAAAAVVFAGVAAAVTDVVVAGRPVVTGGRHVVIEDPGAALAAAIEAAWGE
ncbi:MAG: formimidoylglutamate deiminase [Actinomycetota bacterium]|nr:formimidoylglutamate deiminase [Actinomycetota bacterium]